MNPHRLIGHLVRNGDRSAVRRYLSKLLDVQNGRMDFFNDGDVILMIDIRTYMPRIFWWTNRDYSFSKLQEYIKDEPT